MSITNSTLSGNSADVFGGAIYTEMGAKLTTTDSTLSGNSASGGPSGHSGGAIYNDFGTVTLGGNIVANSTGGNCAGIITDNAYNLEDDAGPSCGFSSANHDIVGSDPELGSLANNGGPTQTMTLATGSPAIDATPAGSPGCPMTTGTDQRGPGYPRPDDSETSCDIGASESAYNPYSVKVTVTTSGHFISTDPQTSASLPLHVHVSNATDGLPLAGATIRLSNPNLFLGALKPVTDSSGNLDTSIALPPSSLPGVGTAPVNGDVTSEVIASVSGHDWSSGQLTLYSGQLLAQQVNPPLTPAEALTYTAQLLLENAAQPSLLDLCGWAHCNGISAALSFLEVTSQACSTYNVQAGDVLKYQVYEDTSPVPLPSSGGATPVYYLVKNIVRAGNTICSSGAWTENYQAVQQYVKQQLARTALVARFASPVTVMATDPTGKRFGYDPTRASVVSDVPGAISNVGDEPYMLVIPQPTPGDYKLQITGTGAGTYTLTLQALDGNGNLGPAVTASGTAFPHVTDSFTLTYPPASGQPINLERQVAIDVKPGEDPPAIKQDEENRHSQ